MLFHENRLLADDSRVISCLLLYHFLFYSKLGKIRQNLSSAAVVIGALRVKWQSLLVNILASVQQRRPTTSPNDKEIMELCMG